MKDRLFQIWFSLRCGVACREFVDILNKYGSPYEVFEADEGEIMELPISEKLKYALSDKSLDESYSILNYCEKNNVGLLFWTDKNYPASLRVLTDPPILLYYRGSLPDFSASLFISVVGTRKMSEYGKSMAYKIGYELGASRAVVVSGMALGIDSVAAAGALAAGGTTVAVLGCGIDIVYPAAHKNFMREIIERGGIVMTEYPPATEPAGRNFPVRNRIISGLGRATVVVEADMKSGALITAKTALMQGKELYAVPGNVGEDNASGTNMLIHDGAIITLRGRDIIDNYAFIYSKTLDTARLIKAEKISAPDDAFLSELGVYTKAVRKNTEDVPHVDLSPKAAPPKTKPPKKEKAEERRHTPDDSDKILETLTETQKKIFTALPIDRAVTVDYLTREGFSLSDVIASMTILEIKGLVISLPGGLYSRK